MPEPVFMGIDGGGSKLRVALVDSDLAPLASFTGSSANPNIVGHETAQQRIRHSIGETLKLARMARHEVSAVGIGVAGASNRHSERWLVQTVAPALSSCRIVPSSDLEIALVGALAQRHGILLLAGTGSAVYGATPAGLRLQTGGWGYLLGDEGSSYWIGSRLLKGIVDARDGGAQQTLTTLQRRCLGELGLSQPRDLIAWLYRADEAPPVRMASLARFVLRQAESGNWQALNIVQAAAIHLVKQVKTLQRRLDYPGAPIAFAGGLLDHGNYLSDEVARRLSLTERPTAKFAPVTGAALLARMEWRQRGTT